MTTQEEKIRVNARIPKSLYDWLNSEYDNVSQAINEGLEILKESKTSGLSYNYKDVIQDSHTTLENVIQEHTTVIQDVIQEPNVIQPVIQEPEAVIQPVIQDDIHTLKTLTKDQKGMIEEYKAQVQNLNAEISRLKTVIMEAPDPFEMVKLQERNEGLLRLSQEKEERIKDLTREVERLDIFAHYFKNVEIKQIEAPAAERKKPWYKFW